MLRCSEAIPPLQRTPQHPWRERDLEGEETKQPPLPDVKKHSDPALHLWP